MPPGSGQNPARSGRGAPDAASLLIGGYVAVSIAALLIVVLGAVAGMLRPGHGAGTPGQALATSLGIGARTIAVSILIGVFATMFSVPVTWSLRGRPRVLLVVIAAPLLLPQYLVFASWGVLRAPGTLLGDWLERSGTGPWWDIVRWVQAVGGLSLWAFPLAALAMAPAAARIDQGALDAMRLAGAGPIQRARMILAMLRPSLIGSAGLVALVMLGSAVPLHVAQIDTWAIVVWRELQETAGSARAWRAAAPLGAVSALAGAGLGAWLQSRPDQGASNPEPGATPRPWRADIVTVGVWLLAVAAPAVILALHLKQRSSLRRFWQESADAALSSLGLACVVGVITAGVAVLTSIAFSQPERSAPRRLGGFALSLSFAGALIPGILVGSSIVSASGVTPVLGCLTSTCLGLVLAHVIRFAAVGAVVGWWTARAEPREHRESRLLAGSGIDGWWHARGRSCAGLWAASGLASGALSLHEIEAAVVVSPPGDATLSQHMLSLLHYLRDEQLTAGTLWLTIIALALAGAASWLASPRLRHVSARLITIVTFAGVCAAIPSCREASAGSDDGPRPLPNARVIGEPGKAPGQFVKPRAIDTDGRRLFVADMTGRLQVLDLAGHPLAWWTMPLIDRGKPTGITWAPGLGLFVADSHEHRVALYPDPPDHATHIDIAGQWGSYGTGPGQFIFPADVLVVPGTVPGAERLYVSEYGENDRVSVFDRDHRFLFSFGREGDAEDQRDVRFRRPQSLLLDARTRTLVIADACNHRVGLFEADGTLRRWIGRTGASPGSALGEFNYPYGLCQLPDRTVLVCEQGGARVQRLDIDRAIGLEVYGRRGAGVGELDAPWGITYAEGEAFICDAGNHRILAFRVPALSSTVTEVPPR